jgi:hypothetical protein
MQQFPHMPYATEALRCVYGMLTASTVYVWLADRDRDLSPSLHLMAIKNWWHLPFFLCGITPDGVCTAAAAAAGSHR